MRTIIIVYVLFVTTNLSAQQFRDVYNKFGFDRLVNDKVWIVDYPLSEEQIWTIGIKGFGRGILPTFFVDLNNYRLQEITDFYQKPFFDPGITGWDEYYDINNDGFPDVVGFADVATGNHMVLLGDESRFYESNRILTLPPTLRLDGWPYYLNFCGDLNFDGNLDIIVYDSNGYLPTRIFTYNPNNNAFDSLSLAQYFSIYEYNEFYKIQTIFQIPDLNDDGKFDMKVVYRSKSDSQDSFHENFLSDILTKTYKRKTINTLPNNGSFYDTTEMYDYDSDGKLDFIRVSTSTSRLNIFKRSSHSIESGQLLFEIDKNIIFLNGYDSTGTADEPSIADLNNDGYPDIIHHCYTKNSFDILVAQPFTRNQMVYYNIADEAFEEKPGYITGVTLFDLDQDGDLDFSAGEWVNSPARDRLRIYQNQLDQADGNANWIQIWLEGTDSPRTPIGAKLILVNNDTSGIVWWKQARSYQFSNDGYMQHFGLHFRDQVDSIYVLWPSGNRDTLVNVPANQRLVIKEGETHTGIKDYSRLPEAFELEQNYPNPFNPETTIRFTLRKAATVELSIFNQLGQQIQVLQSGFLPAGTHQVSFRADQLASGVYLYRLKAGRHVQSRKMVVVK